MSSCPNSWAVVINPNFYWLYQTWLQNNDFINTGWERLQVNMQCLELQFNEYTQQYLVTNTVLKMKNTMLMLDFIIQLASLQKMGPIFTLVAIWGERIDHNMSSHSQQEWIDLGPAASLLKGRSSGKIHVTQEMTLEFAVSFLNHLCYFMLAPCV